MRHLVFGRKLGRDINARHALLGNLASALIVNGHLNTTTAKAKFTRAYVEKLITMAKKKPYVVHRRIAQEISKPAFKKLITEIGPGFENRAGGYTRIVKLASRIGDNAPMARLELLKLEKPEKKTANKSVSSVVA